MKNLTDITIILDRSGSMESVRSDTIGGFNAFLKTQQEAPGDAVLSLVQFDMHYEPLYAGVPVKDAAQLSNTTFQPRGSTALYDAIGRTINDIGQRLTALAAFDRPDKVVVVIMTDGEENASREFGSAKIAEMIGQQGEKYNWQFLFVGANQDAILSAKTIGIAGSHAMSYAANAVGTHAVYDSIGANVTSYRQSGVAEDAAFSMEDRLKQEEAGAVKESA